jgi:hypothetical protein
MDIAGWQVTSTCLPWETGTSAGNLRTCEGAQDYVYGKDLLWTLGHKGPDKAEAVIGLHFRNALTNGHYLK